MFEVVLLVLGLFGLWLGTELIIKAAVRVAKQFRVSEMFVGLTILAIGTDLPELIVNISASFTSLSGTNSSGLIFGSIMGSGMGQIALTLGLFGLFAGNLFLKKRQLLREGFMLIASVVVLFLLTYSGTVSRLEGIVLMLVYVIYFTTLHREEKSEGEPVRAKRVDMLWAGVSLVGGFIILFFASEAVVHNSLALAEQLGIAQSLVGVLIIGVGTSLPELVLALGSIRSGAHHLGVGNLIGSNIFDVLFVTGLSAAIFPLSVPRNLYVFDLPFLFITSVIVILLFFRDQRLKRNEAAILVLMYVVYVVMKIVGF
jgi:cation:H+ antiporter